MHLRHRLILSALLLSGAQANAADFCVANQNDLINALIAASSSAEDDTIRLSASTINLTALQIDPQLRGGLRILGGYGSACTIPLPGASTTLNAGAALSLFQLRLRDDDLTLARLNFVSFPSVRVSDAGHVSDFPTGRISIDRVVVRDGGDGLNLYSNHHHVRIENSILARNDEPIGTAIGYGIGLNRGQGALIDVELINNTIADNKFGVVLVTDGDFDANIYLYNNIAYDNAQIDLTSEFLLFASHNLWATQFFGPGAGLTASSNNNLSVNPQFDGDYDPIAPGSPLINSGNNEPRGGLSSTDVDGGPRLIGSRVDRGAQETSVNDISTFTVTNTDDSGSGSLRTAIMNANQSTDPSEIRFNLLGACPRIITPSTPLPILTSPIRFLGYTQPGSVRNASLEAFDGTLCVALNGAGALPTGLNFATGLDETMMVDGIAFYGFTSQALLITGVGRGTVQGNTFGTGAAGLIAPGFNDAAIRVRDAPGTLIGGVDVATRNVISRAAQSGIHLASTLSGTAGREVRGNLIGFNLAASSGLPNGVGIHVEGSSGDSLYDNIIGYNTSHGLLVNGTPAPSDMRINGNYLGFSPAIFGPGQEAGNGANGARFETGSLINFNNNQVFFNGTDGVVVTTAARRISISANRYRSNGAQAIDLSPDGVNPIDLDVGATGANDQQNYPTLTSASGSANSGTVSGSLSSANDTYVIRLFRNAQCDANGFGEAQALIGEAVVTITDAGGNSNGQASFSAAVSAGTSLLDEFVTAIATDSQGNTSEASACIPYSQGPQIFSNGFE